MTTLPTRYGHWLDSTPRKRNDARATLCRRIRLPASARIALLFAALGACFGCAAPAPPRPPKQEKPGAAKSAKTGTAISSNFSPVVPSVSKSSQLTPPQDLAAIPIQKPSGSLEVDVSWAISGVENLAGYNVYRSQQQGKRGVRLNRHLLAAPEFRDTTAAVGASYRYTVTSVDAAGNESAPSAPVTVNVPGTNAGSH